MKLSLIAIFIIAGALAIEGAWQVLVPPFSDAQVAASLVDTWQPHAVFTNVVLVLLFFAICFVVAVQMLGGPKLRGLAYAALVALSIAGGTQVAGHIALSHQVTRVTGQALGPMCGLL
jgi:hypothetical protein